MARTMKWRRDGTSTAPKQIDIYLEGGPRLQISSGVTTRDGYENRRRAIKEDWGRGGVWRDAVAGLNAKRFSVGEWYDQRAQGLGALTTFLAAAGTEPLIHLVDDYIKQLTTADRARTRQKLERLVRFFGKSASAGDLTPTRIDEFLGQLIDRRTAKTTREPAKGSTVNRYRAAVSGLCTWAIRRERLAVHPIAGKKVEKREEPSHRIPEMSIQEYRDYVACVRAQRPDLAVILLLLIHTAPDVGEIFNLLVRDVDLETRRIRYQRTKTRHHRTANMPRLVPLPSIVVEELRGHIAEHRVRGSELLFASLSRRDVETTHERAARLIARPELTLKDLRHIAAIAWVKAGVHIRVVQRYLGHASLSQTMKYTDFEPDEGVATALAERAFETLNKGC